MFFRFTDGWHEEDEDVNEEEREVIEVAATGNDFILIQRFIALGTELYARVVSL
jgi:hypothetical protein